MSSYTRSDSTRSSDLTICTTASVFEKANSVKFELLFGKYNKKIDENDDKNDLINSFKYIFTPGQIFGFSYESFGKDFQKFHHAFVLQACVPGEKGHIITGIQPGAKIIVSAPYNAAALRLKLIITKLQKYKIDLSQLSIIEFQRLHRLLEVKSNLQFAIGELLARSAQ